jgi:hypothetical protein
VPIRHDFVRIMTKVIDQHEKERIERVQQEKLLGGYRQGERWRTNHSQRGTGVPTFNIIISGSLKGADQFHPEFTKMDRMLDHHFIVNKGFVL